MCPIGYSLVTQPDDIVLLVFAYFTTHVIEKYSPGAVRCFFVTQLDVIALLIFPYFTTQITEKYSQGAVRCCFSRPT